VELVSTRFILFFESNCYSVTSGKFFHQQHPQAPQIQQDLQHPATFPPFSHKDEHAKTEKVGLCLNLLMLQRQQARIRTRILTAPISGQFKLAPAQPPAQTLAPPIPFPPQLPIRPPTRSATPPLPQTPTLATIMQLPVPAPHQHQPNRFMVILIHPHLNPLLARNAEGTSSRQSTNTHSIWTQSSHALVPLVFYSWTWYLDASTPDSFLVPFPHHVACYSVYFLFRS
jgi:hypothetical protein